MTEEKTKKPLSKAPAKAAKAAKSGKTVASSKPAKAPSVKATKETSRPKNLVIILCLKQRRVQ